MLNIQLPQPNCRSCHSKNSGFNASWVRTNLSVRACPRCSIQALGTAFWASAKSSSEGTNATFRTGCVIFLIGLTIQVCGWGKAQVAYGVERAILPAGTLCMPTQLVPSGGAPHPSSA